MNWEDLYSHAIQWVKEAGERIRQSFDTTLNIQTKSNPNDLVTNMDREIEQFFISKIRESYPGHKVMGEEGFGDSLEALEGIVWIIDPIDGTMNFIHQQRNFAISLGVMEDGIGKIGIIYDVAHDEFYRAMSGKGAFYNDKPLPVLSEKPLKESIIAMNASLVMENSKFDHRVFASIAWDARGTRSYGTAALELVYVATGRVDAYLSLRLMPWDIAGGFVILQELGGVVTNMQGQSLNFLVKDSVLAAKPGLHQAILTDYLQNGQWKKKKP